MDVGAPRQLGDFGEGLVNYALLRKGFKVACVDHVGADLIAHKDPHRLAVSVKTSLYREKSVTTRRCVIAYDHVDKLAEFAAAFALDPVFAQVVCIVDERAIHLFMMRVADAKERLDKVQHGYRLRFGRAHLEGTIALPYVDYSCWTGEMIGTRLF
jgi:hypothetical protein